MPLRRSLNPQMQTAMRIDAMRTITKMLAGAAGVAAFAAAAPATAQYYPYGSQSTYGYSNPYGHSTYGNAYGYNTYNGYGNYGAYGVNASAAAQQCTAAVQNRLYSRTGLAQIIGSLVGIPANSGRVVALTSTTPTRTGLRIRGLASSGRYAYNNYSPYGVGAYGALGYGANQSADLSFKCDVDYRGYVRNVDITRRY
jgi:hypothetical protein